MKGAYTTEEVIESMNKRDPREFEYGRLLIASTFAETPEEEKIAEENLKKFEKENAKLVDDIHTRRWTDPY